MEKLKKSTEKKTAAVAVDKVKLDLNQFTKDKIKEDLDKTNKTIDKLQKEIDNVDILVNANKLKILELKERVQLLEGLKKQTF